HRNPRTALGHRGLRDRDLDLTYHRPGLPHLSETPGAGSRIYSSLGPQSGRGHAALMPRRRLPGGTRMAGGEVVIETFDSQVLKGNPLKDPTRRDVAIYLPPKYDPRKRYPAAYGIVVYTGTGKSLFEYCYTTDFPKALAAFREHDGPAKWLQWFWRQPNRRLREMEPVLNTIGMAAHYSPNPKSREFGIDFPFDLETGEWRPEVWARWRRWDPVNMVDRYAPRLRRLRLVYIDCGTKDQYNLIWGARVLHKKLGERRIPHVYK